MIPVLGTCNLIHRFKMIGCLRQNQFDWLDQNGQMSPTAKFQDDKTV